MGRPKGSTNKKKAVEKIVESVDKTEVKEVGQSPLLCLSCSHIKDFHYGGLKGHCNTPNCGCLEFK